MNKTIIYILALTLFCCQSKNSEIDNILKKCIVEKVNEEALIQYGSKSTDFFKLMINVENLLFENHQLKLNSKEEYIIGISAVLNINDLENSEIQRQLNTLFENAKIDRQSVMFYSIIYYNCPREILEIDKFEKNKTLKLQFEMIDELSKLGFSSEQSKAVFKDWVLRIPEEDFKKILYRSTIVLALSSHLAGKL